MAVMHDLDWLFAIGVLFFCLSIWGIGANDVANSYATSVSSRSLTLVQAGVLATITEFIGAITMGQQVTSTIRHGIFGFEPFENSPGILVLAMVVAEIGSATWLTLCTRLGFPVSTTQSIVGALVGVGIAADIHVNWGWQDGSVSQIAASWGIAPAIAAGFGAVIMMSINVLVHWRSNPLKAALRVITFYYGLTAGILTLFILISGGHGIPSIEEQGAGQVVGIVLGVFFGIWLLSAIFFLPYYYRRLIKEDHRLRVWHIPMGPLLWRDNYTLYWPGDATAPVTTDYYATEYVGPDDSSSEDLKKENGNEKRPTETDDHGIAQESREGEVADAGTRTQAATDKARQKDLAAVDSLPWIHPKRILATTKLVLTYGITRDIIAHQSRGLEHVHARAPRFDNKVEHLWTTAQVCSAMIMSVAHGANDVSNAIGPFTTEYETWRSGVASSETDTPTWIKAVGGLGLGFGFWTYGYHIMRNLGNRVTKHSPTRGFSMELAAAITVLLASRLGLPVSTTQCITGGIIGVALCNMDLRSINWKQVGKIFIGWVLTVPCAALVAGIIMGMALNVPRWGPRP
ncbi:phosphate transporter [Lineolata rhizophorae]|uniref:Phosphate transporter n=1 Tax=Lineolata rhizophorae TaxID=578093 RepID=A0A6A6P5W5_9PEZI|nr:phosphate transporter [Lineolata rhizophorae]